MNALSNQTEMNEELPEPAGDAGEAKREPRLKRIWKSKWARRALRTGAVLVTLVAVGYAGIDWWGARQKAQAVKELAARGIVLGQPGEAAPLPPAEDNFGALKLFVDLRGENPPKESALDDYWMDRSHVASVRKGFKQPKRGEAFHAEVLKGYLPGAEMPEARWEAFETHNQEVLAVLRGGMSRSEAVAVPWLDGSDPLALLTASGKHLLRMRNFCDWLICRAYLAMDAKRPEDAMESLLILRRLADVTGCDETLVGKLVGGVLDSTLFVALGNGIDAGVWNEAQLSRMERALAPRPGGSARWQQTMLREGRAAVALLNHLKEHPEGWETMISLGTGDERLLAKWLPNGLLDLGQKREMEILGRTMDLLRHAGPAEQWEQAEEMYVTAGPGKNFANLLNLLEGGGNLPIVAVNVLKAQVRLNLKQAQARLACRLGIYKAQHGRYPAALGDLGVGAEEMVDVFSGKAFCYRVDGEKFVLYSVGPDGVDDGGKGVVNRHQSSDKAADWVW